MEESKFTPVEAGQFVLSIGGGQEYVQLPAGEPLKMHISKIETVMAKKFQSEELEEKLAVSFKNDETGDGEGQVYSAWFRPSLNPKAKLTNLVLALYGGKIPDSLDVTEMVGLPVRVVLTEGEEKNGKLRQYIASYLKPSNDQKKVEIAQEEVVDQGLNEDELDELFG